MRKLRDRLVRAKPAGEDPRPVLLAIAGPNGAGKTTFYHAFIESSGLRFLNPDLIARELHLNPEDTAKSVSALRKALMQAKESFAFETVFSDPVGDKLEFLKQAAESGYAAVLCFIGLAGPETSDERVTMRVSQGGHDVPSEKLAGRYSRGLANLRKALQELPLVYVFDNEDLRTPYRKVAVFEDGKPLHLAAPVPEWLAPLLPEGTAAQR